MDGNHGFGRVEARRESDRPLTLALLGALAAVGRRLLLALFLLAGVQLGPRGASAATDAYPRQPKVDVLSYEFGIGLSDENDTIEGLARLRIQLREPSPSSLELDLASLDEDGLGMVVESVLGSHGPGSNAGAEALTWVHADDRLRISLPAASFEASAMAAEPLAPPAQPHLRVVLEVRYRGAPREGLIISDNKHGDRTFFGDNWPEGARQWLPTIDHPSDKALCAFAVSAPSHYQVVGCGRLQEETDLEDGRRLTVWRSEEPMATKVMVIGVARFAVERVAEVDGVEIQSWLYPQDRDAGFFDFARAERVLRFFVGHLGPFPYAKIANVQSRTRYGGTENASNIFYNENSVRGDRSNEGLIAHEIAHQWFGDAVTEGDWQHVWLSEGFATYLTQLYLEFTYGRDRLVEGMRRARDRVFDFERKEPRSMVIESSVSDPRKLLTANSYQKGAWVLHMLRREVGDEALWAGLRELYRRFRHRNALTPDFVRIMEEVSGRDLGEFFRRWLQRPGHPLLEGAWWFDQEAGDVVIELNQRQPGEPYPVIVDVELVGVVEGSRRQRLEMAGISGEWHLEAATAPQEVRLDPDVWLLAEVARFGPKREPQRQR